MLIHDESLGHYLNLISEGRHFSFAGYSDAEWRCIFGGEWEGTTTGLGQTISAEHGKLLADVIKRRWNDPRFMFAVPKCLWPHQERETQGFRGGVPGFAEGQVDWWLGSQGIRLEGWERDRPLDDAARKADLFPLIDRLRSMRTVMIGPRELWPTMQRHLGLSGFVQIDSPNLHMIEGGIDVAVQGVLRLTKMPNTVYLISAGVSAAVIIDRLHYFKDCWLIDCGSIWDAFAGIGGQREWRAELYKDGEKLREWKRWNLTGKPWRLM